MDNDIPIKLWLTRAYPKEASDYYTSLVPCGRLECAQCKALCKGGPVLNTANVTMEKCFISVKEYLAATYPKQFFEWVL